MKYFAKCVCVNLSSTFYVCVVVFIVQLYVIQRAVLPRPFCTFSVSLSNACIVTKRKILMPTFSYHMKDCSSYFSDKKNGW